MYRLVIYESAEVILHIADDGVVRVANLFAKKRRQGHATKLMQKVIDMADRAGWSLYLDVQRYGISREGLSNNQLIDFYQKFGFVLGEKNGRQDTMHRVPQKKETQDDNKGASA